VPFTFVRLLPVIPSEVAGSRDETLKLAHRDPSTLLGMTGYLFLGIPARPNSGTFARLENPAEDSSARFFPQSPHRGYDLSPDGQTISFLQPWESRLNIFVKKNEGYGFRNEENKFDFYEAMEKFLEKHLDPETTAASSASGSGSR
jgi:hypothetical protein